MALPLPPGRPDPRPPSVGLRAKLTGLVLMALIPLVVLQTALIYLQFRRRTQDEVNACLGLTQASRATFVSYLTTLWTAESAMGVAISFRDNPLPPDQAETMMRQQLLMHPGVDSFAWVSPAGIILASTSGSRGLSCADRDHIRRIVGGEANAVSDLLEGRLAKRPTLMVAHGIRRNGALLGIVVASVDPAQLALNLPIQSLNDRVVSLADRNSVLVYRSGVRSDKLGTRRFQPGSPVDQALHGKDVLFRHILSTIDGQPKMGAALPVSDIGWAITVTAPIDKVLAGARSDALANLIGLLVVALVSVLGVNLVGNAFLRPIQALREAAMAIAEGDLSARVNRQGADEIAVAGRTFDIMADRIQELESDRMRFLQVAAHELRNPMASVKGICSLLRMQVVTGLDDAASMLKIMEREVDRLAALLDEILEAFLIQEGRLSQKHERLDMVEVVKAALEPYLVSAHKHEFVFEGLENGPIYVYGDFRRLEEVARNLISNAVKYSPDGGTVRVALGAVGGKMRLTIADQGFGIPNDQLTRVFEGFYRADNLAGRDPGGIGLGLYICKDIVQGHGGHIWAESGEQGGSAFHVELPIVETEGTHPWHAS